MKRHALFLTLWAAALVSFCRADGQHPLVEVDLDGRRIEGTPLAWSKTDVFLLARDGHLWNFDPKSAANYRKVSDHFTSYSPNDMRTALRTEFGREFDVSGTGHYLVVHPKGERNEWAPRFEELYRNYMRYFTARGFEPQAPQFPLIAIVFRNEQDFLKYARKTDAKLLPGTLGYYSPVTNRILLYDVTAGRHDNNPQWEINAETIVHEAIHQMAFNTGVHSRYSMPPRWVAEGLGTVFEARGVWNSKRFTQQADRINRYRFDEFNRYVSRRKTGSIAEFVSSDRMFQSDPEGAYAEAWALTFFLFETQPKRYVEYLQVTGDRPQFTELRAPERLAEFTRVFGTDLRQLESRYLKFIAGMK
jgi:hypothetical protein